jgi:hypothetical protein
MSVAMKPSITPHGIDWVDAELNTGEALALAGVALGVEGMLEVASLEEDLCGTGIRPVEAGRELGPAGIRPIVGVEPEEPVRVWVTKLTCGTVTVYVE